MLPRASITLRPYSSTMPVVLVEDLGLEDAEALGRVRAPAHVHAGLVELQLHAPGQQPVERDVDRHAEVDRQIRPHGEAVEVAHPWRSTPRATSRANAV